MAALDDVQVQSVVGVDGNSYTTSISNDKLTNDDFLKLMLEEMRMQDPTDPMDSSALMDSQLKMSTIQANVDMATAMTQLQASYANSALSNAANLVGRVVEDGQINDEGLLKSYKVQTVQNIDGELYVNANEMIGYMDTLYNSVDETYVLYDANGKLYNNDGSEIGLNIKMEDGRFVLDSNDNITLLDSEGDEITDSDITSKYVYGGETIEYSDELQTLQVANIQKIW
jgi:flagellar basal-body rod modification protein FlgD